MDEQKGEDGRIEILWWVIVVVFADRGGVVTAEMAKVRR